MSDAQATLVRMVFGGMAAQAVGAAARMNLPDQLGDSSRTAAELASACDAPATQLVRLLRALAALGICVETEPGRFALTETGQPLRQDHPGSVYEFVRVFTEPVMMAAWTRLDAAVRTGRTQFDEVFGVPFFDYLASKPDLSASFNASMSQGTRAVAAYLPDHYGFDQHRKVVDVGGGDGSLLVALLNRHPHLRGTVFDTSEGAAQAPGAIADAGLTDRCEVAHGDFFDAVPPGGDLYLLKSIIHDWDDEPASTILRHCRAALPAGGRVLIVEPVLPDTVPADARAGLYLSDLNMMVNTGGRERTRTEFERLCAAADLSLTTVIPLPPHTGFCLIEAA